MLPIVSHKRDFSVDARFSMLALLACLIGLLSTAGAWILLNLIHFFTNLFFFQQFSLADRSPADNTLGPWVIALPVLGGLLVGLIARFGTDRIRGHGIPEAIEVILFGKSLMSPKVALLKPLASGIAIGSGGPFGAEGPIIMTGGALGSLVAQSLKMSAVERKTLLVAGAAAGMTAVFGTPVAAVLLAVELLLFEWRPRSFLPVALACAVAGFARILVFGAGPLFPLVTRTPAPAELGFCLLAGLLSGLLAVGMSAALYKLEDLFHKLPVHWMWWPAIGGIAVGIGGWYEPHALGVGYDVIGRLLNGRMPLDGALALLCVKAAIWVIALASGTSGGVLAPLLMIGAGLGLVLAHALPGTDPALWPLVCMAATLAATLGAPLTALVFAFGLTHDANALLPLLTATLVAHGCSALLVKRSIMTEKIARRGRHIYREYGVDPLERNHVGDVMSGTPTTITATTSLDAVRATCFGATQRHRAYPVVRDGALCGMLDREGCEHAIERFGAAASIGEALRDVPFHYALPGENCRALATRLATLNLERLPVISDVHSLRLIGIVARSDLIGLARAHFDEEHMRERYLPV